MGTRIRKHGEKSWEVYGTGFPVFIAQSKKKADSVAKRRRTILKNRRKKRRR